MKEHSEAFKEAFKLIGLNPMPRGTAKKIVEYEKQIRPDEQDKFDWIWEGYMAAADEEGIKEMHLLDK